MRHPGHTLDFVAGECGFADARQLRRLWKDHYGTAPSTWKGRPG
jgi:transcriptional regulator GlxA family with amidase domain